MNNKHHRAKHPSPACMHAQKYHLGPGIRRRLPIRLAMGAESAIAAHAATLSTISNGVTGWILYGCHGSLVVSLPRSPWLQLRTPQDSAGARLVRKLG